MPNVSGSGTHTHTYIRTEIPPCSSRFRIITQGAKRDQNPLIVCQLQTGRQFLLLCCIKRCATEAALGGCFGTFNRSFLTFRRFAGANRPFPPPIDRLHSMSNNEPNTRDTQGSIAREGFARTIVSQFGKTSTSAVEGIKLPTRLD